MPGRSFVVYQPLTPKHDAIFLSWESLPPSLVFWCHVGSLINMFEVLRLRIFFDVFLNVPTGQVGLQILFHHKIHGCLGQVFGNSSPPVSIWNFSVLQVHRLLPNIFIQKNCSIVRSWGETEVNSLVCLTNLSPLSFLQLLHPILLGDVNDTLKCNYQCSRAKFI